MGGINLADTKDRNTTPKQIVSKICYEVGCEKEYFGHRITKYCEFHRNPRNRAKKASIKTDVTIDNQIFLHNFVESADIVFTCALEGCLEEFEIRVIPKINIYPKYCENHRSQYRRTLKEE